MRRALVIACIVAVGVAFALAYGEGFGAKNQQTYLVDGLVRAFPDLYRADWFVTQNHHYHVAFAYLTAPLFAIDPDGAIALGIAQLVTMVATFVAIYFLIAAVTQRGRLIVFAGIVGLLALGGNRALGGSYLYAGYLQPSSFAVLGWLVAMNAWLRDRPLAAGVALAAGAAFHLNYAVLGIGMFALCELAATRRFDARRLAMLLAPSLVVLAVFLPTLIASSRAADDQAALDVLVQFAFPGHFKPHRLRNDLASLGGWLLIALAMRPAAHRADSPARMFWFATVVMSSCIVAAVMIAIPPLLTLTRLFVWRVAPIGILAAQILLFVGVREIARGERPRPTGRQLAVVLAGATAIVYNAFTRRSADYPEVITCTLLASAAAIAARREQIASVACAALCAFALWSGRVRLVSPAMFGTVELGATKWARTASPPDAVFLVPPYYGEFRLLARRAVVVDDKSPPMYMNELLAWHQRLSAAVGARSLVSLDEGRRRYDALPADRLIEIARQFHASYVVIDRTRTNTRLPAPVAFEDISHVVFAVGN